jgi:hypothetical protein
MAVEILSIDREQAKKRSKSLLLAAERIRPASLALEASLMTLKWYDYRFMSPLDATLLFGALYQKQFQATIARVVDRRLAQNVRGIDMTKIMTNKRQLTALWNARQHADRLGIRYPEYLQFCFAFYTDVKRKALPRPNQLYFSEASEVAWLTKLMKFWPERVFEGLAKVDDLPQYRFEAFENLPAQRGYRQFILDRAKGGTKRLRDTIIVHSVEKRQFPIRQFELLATDREHFRHELRSLRDYGKSFPFSSAPDVQMTKDQFWQSCFGVPHAYSAESDPCVSCPQSSGCERLAGRILELVVARHGTTDPVRQKERDATKERVGRCRAKKKSNTGQSSINNVRVPEPGHRSA